MTLQKPAQQSPPPLQSERDHEIRLCEAEVRRRANEAVMLEARTKLHQLLALIIAATVGRPEECATFHARAKQTLIGRSYKWEAKAVT